jgi:hypothetical protein
MKHKKNHLNNDIKDVHNVINFIIELYNKIIMHDIHKLFMFIYLSIAIYIYHHVRWG